MNRTSMPAGIRSFLIFLPLLLQSASVGRAATATPPDILFSPTKLDFKYKIAGAQPAVQTLQIKSTGAALTFQIAITGPAPYNGQWLSLTAMSGTTSASIKTYVNATGMPSGAYSAVITVTPGAGTANQSSYVLVATLEVSDTPPLLTVTTPVTTTPSSTAATMNFAYTTGAVIMPPNQSITVMTQGTGPATATVAVSGGKWLTAAPTGTISLIGLPQAITVKVDPTGLAPGNYTGKITVASSNASNKSVAVNVSFAIQPGNPTINAVNGIWPPGIPAPAGDTMITIRGSNFFSTTGYATTAVIGTTTLTTSVINGNTMTATIPTSLLQTPTPVATPLVVTVSTPTATNSATGTFAVYGAGPVVLSVVNSGSYNSGVVSPGEIVTIYGYALGPTAVTPFNGTSLSTAIAGTSVTIGGFNAPLLYTSATQVSCIVPYSLSTLVTSPASTANVAVTYNDGTNTLTSSTTPASTVTVAAADPGVFTVDQTGQAAVLNINGTTGDLTVNSTTNPAVKGSNIAIYLTGLGLTSCTGTCVGTYTVIAGSPPVTYTFPDETQFITGTVTPTVPPTVTIGGQTATSVGTPYVVTPAGSVAGLFQLAVTVPTTLPTGKVFDVVVTSNGVDSLGTATIAVK